MTPRCLDFVSLMLLCFAVLPLPAQAPTQSAAPGPTMQETGAFIREAFATQGSFTTYVLSGPLQYSAQAVVLRPPCGVEVQVTTASSDPASYMEGTERRLVHLDRADPLTVVVKRAESHTPALFYITGKAVSEPLAVEVFEPGTVGELVAPFKLRGFVRSFDQGLLQLISNRGEARRL